MDYEKKYKEALNWMQSLYDGLHGATKKDAEHYFPELKESEDERIRKELICFLETEIPQCAARDKYVAWLEKQKEFVSVDFDDVWEVADCDELTAPLGKYSKDAIKNMCHAWYDKGIELERKSWLEKQCEQDPYNGVSFKCNGHTWGMCARDNGVDILLDRQLIKHLEKQGEKKQDPCEHCDDKRLNCHNFPCIKKRAFKQGKSALEVINEEKVDNQNCVKTVDKVEQKFQEGEWITNGDYTGKIVEVKPLYYILQSQDGNIVDDTISHVDKQFHSFTIKDAKAGDVLVIQGTDFSYESIFIFNKIENNHINQYLHYFITDKGEEVCKVKSVGGFIGFVEENVHPATKEQREQLEKAMADAGYSFDFDKKELKKIEQKSFWSEEDERQWNNIYDVLDGHFELSKEGYKNAANWFKAIKGRVQPQPKQKWSKDDKVMLDEIIDFLENGTVKLQHDLSLYASWLKSLKQRYTWKPSDEQIKAVKLARSFVTDDFGEHPTLSEILVELEKQLKKLK